MGRADHRATHVRRGRVIWMNVLHIDQLIGLVEEYGSSVYWDMAKAGFWHREMA
jgi:hypothetical protein